MNAGKDGRQELGEWKHGSTGTTLLGMFYNPALSITRVPMLEFHSCELPDISLPDIHNRSTPGASQLSVMADSHRPSSHGLPVQGGHCLSKFES